MQGDGNRAARIRLVLRVALAVFVLGWIFGPYALRAAVPIWAAFLVALGLELQFFLGALRSAEPVKPDRGPQAVDQERYGFPDEGGEQDSEGPAVIGREKRGARAAVRRLLVGLTVIGALAVVLWAVESNTGWEALDAGTRVEATDRFSDEASRIAEKQVIIRCDEEGARVGVVQHADGVAEVGGDLAYLTPERCLDLYRLAFKGDVTWSQTARAVAVLAHEAWHLRGIADEGTTECYALQSGVELGQQLGLSEETAQRMMRQELAENAVRDVSSLAYRVPPECRDGGRLDLHPELGRFP